MSETSAPYTIQRIIKFRLRNVATGELIPQFDGVRDDGTPFWIDGDGVVESFPNLFATDVSVEQYTGCKDKNGREIYEADVIEKEIEGPHGQKALFRGVVRYWGSGFFLAIPGFGSELLYSNSQRNGTVIGTIGEHPELMK